MKNKNNYKVWGLSIIAVAVIIVGIVFTITQIQQRDSAVNNGIGESKPQQNVSQPADTKEKDATGSTEKEENNLVESNQLALFTGDTDTYNKKELETISVQEDLRLEKKLEIIAYELSKMYFDNFPIEIKAIEQVDGKKIAVINLKEKQESNDKNKTWMQYLNAGSTGSKITLITLEESFLQRDFKGEWIDAIKIIYEEKDIEELDHFPGTEVIYR
ncbi:hypothetical protein [Cellulosilyticum sp. I15G10I2]|uniref:hypothetical protein n=1 Tax=Cellulosilyticum sp. I15G10I2 TaxID=1892843 RepID=UPI00085CCADB|nr:hypothetical protein [Cellulosilyticum sp. I15G10I2]